MLSPSEFDKLRSIWSRKIELLDIAISIETITGHIQDELSALVTRDNKYHELIEEVVGRKENEVNACLLLDTQKKHNIIVVKTNAFCSKVDEIVGKNSEPLLEMDDNELEKIAVDDEKGTLMKLIQATVFLTELKVTAVNLKSEWDAAKGELENVVVDSISWAQELLQTKLPNPLQTIQGCHSLLKELGGKRHAFMETSDEYQSLSSLLSQYLKTQIFPFLPRLHLELLDSKHQNLMHKHEEARIYQRLVQALENLKKFNEERDQLRREFNMENMSSETRKNLFQSWTKLVGNLSELDSTMKDLKTIWDDLKLKESADGLILRIKNLCILTQTGKLKSTVKT